MLIADAMELMDNPEDILGITEEEGNTQLRGRY